MTWLVHTFLHDFGMDDPSGAWYLFWSGIFGDIAIFAAAVGLYRAHNCHQKGCWRIAKHPLGKFKVCSLHHPHVQGPIRTHTLKQEGHNNP